MSSDGVSDEMDFVKKLGEQDHDAAEDLPASNSPRSSPPPNDDNDDNITAVNADRSIDKKRSHEQMNADSQDVFPSSATMAGNELTSTPCATASEQPTIESVKPSTAAHTSMGPSMHKNSSRAPSTSMRPPYSRIPLSQNTPPSGQGLQKPATLPTRPSNPDSEPAQKPLSPRRKETPEPEELADSLTDPEESIEDFDWTALRERYHDTITKLDQRESEAMKEFAQLCEVCCNTPFSIHRLTSRQYFTVWSNAGGSREVDRSFKRLVFQMPCTRPHLLTSS